MKILITAVIIFGISFYAGSAAGITSDAQQPTIELKTIEPFAICSLRHQGPAADLTQVTEDLISLMQIQSISPAGDLLVIYPIEAGKEISDQLQWEAGFPVGSHIAVLQEPLKKMEWNFTSVAATSYRGPLSQANDVLDTMFEWIVNSDYEQEGPVMVIYKSMPEANSATVEIEIWIPCMEK